MIYFAQDGESGLVKIGYTASSAKSRLSYMKGVNPKSLKLLGLMEGMIVEEAALHKRFGHLRVKGEWFSPADELMTFCQANATQEDVDCQRTNLDVPGELRVRIEVQARADRRKYKAEIIELIEEAVDRREMKAKTRDA